MEARRAELYVHVADRAAETARELGLDPDLAEQLGAAIADAIAEDFGGEVISFPKDAAFKLVLRERSILEAHRNGASFRELKDRYGMTERGIRKLIARAILRDPHLNQRQLF